MSIEAMKQAIDALNEAVAFREGGRQKAIDAITSLRTAIQQAEAKTDEPVAWLYIEDGEVMFGHPNGYRPPDARPLVFGDTHPSPGVPDDAARYALLRERFNKQKMSACQRIVEDLGLDGDPLDGLDFLVDKDRFNAAQAQKGQP